MLGLPCWDQPTCTISFSVQKRQERQSASALTGFAKLHELKTPDVYITSESVMCLTRLTALRTLNLMNALEFLKWVVRG